jgi:hypothetical protein
MCCDECYCCCIDTLIPYNGLYLCPTCYKMFKEMEEGNYDNEEE